MPPIPKDMDSQLQRTLSVTLAECTRRLYFKLHGESHAEVLFPDEDGDARQPLRSTILSRGTQQYFRVHIPV